MEINLLLSLWDFIFYSESIAETRLIASTPYSGQLRVLYR